MQYFSCLPESPLKVLRSASGGSQLAKLNFDDAGAGSETQSIVRVLPPEMLSEILGMTQCSTYKSAVCVSRLWCKTLDNEIEWERLCRRQWPGVTHNVNNSWRKFAMQGGGDMLGASLLHHLKAISAELMSCSATCLSGQWDVLESLGHQCNACGKANTHGTRIRRCRRCGYSRCDKCDKAVQPAAAIANGATNHTSKDGWSALHHACRLGFKDVAKSLLDSRADIECRDDLNGYTPLMVCATQGHEEVCSLLLERGASKDTKNNYGKTAADCARPWGHFELLQLLGRTQ